jgi:hypothetical protein
MGVQERQERLDCQNNRVASKDDLKAKAIGALRRLQKLPGLVRGSFADPHLRYISVAAFQLPLRSTYLRPAQ